MSSWELRGSIVALLLAAVLSGVSGCEKPRSQVAVFGVDAIPAHLSDWHLIEVVDGVLTPNTGVVPYDLNTGLFTDYAHKLRTVWMPAGTSAIYDKEQFEYPVGTILSKTFYYPKGGDGAVLRTDNFADDYAPGRAGEALDMARVRLMETRLLVRREDGWQALPYVWNAAQTEAVLEIAGEVSRLHLKAVGGETSAFNYVVPDANQCAGCHADNFTGREISPLGPRARHLNKRYPYRGGTENQLVYWQKIGYLSGLPELDSLPSLASFSDADLPLEERARAYLDINCGHCHNPAGAADTSGLMLNHSETDWRRLGLCKPPVAAGTGSGERLFAIVPGEPDSSILNFRVESADPGAMMPELGRSLVHEEGAELLRQWVAALPGTCL
ncbi:SO2930 family diheme c-type cytochrome [uncultured Microbulbifer sp.]|uniref:SO2930 family diheme c-type cytochrome n=1 Tax=uncultured Microbulbifer sp. TaxID=348147 RepID=UPI00261ECC59|nr:SO2930 family diheme c-type cytochrome [uncultured Microbulbifer sp.]